MSSAGFVSQTTLPYLQIKPSKAAMRTIAMFREIVVREMRLELQHSGIIPIGRMPYRFVYIERQMFLF